MTESDVSKRVCNFATNTSLLYDDLSPCIDSILAPS